MPRLVPEGDQAGYLKTIEEFKDIFPSEYEVLSKRKWDADTRRMVLLSPEQQYKQTTKDVLLPSGETQTMRYPEFGGGGATPIGGLVGAAQQAGDGALHEAVSASVRHQRPLVETHIIAFLQHRDRRRIGGWAADPELLHLLDEARLGIAGGRLREMLLDERLFEPWQIGRADV